ncbi:hypothetical protein TsFJ059_007406 [Trichoderma semiorbis]|uniref:Ser-Thr-rich glycosyl-phosphatidyl-inositol-anchored membrane family domain-containing protein n=2 Tax=Trichoderma TaxID=5543 RepID=A0A9W9BA44_9HYPO|nr:ser-Thr-rich glycosyl-phosphatidyl-inositol-anchored membrane family domain-containing protein [Trichoderma breve]KAH0524972.1 hypothetical protein TsFJ059_007406 [Trichoderma semiorbis]KAJ4858752.1 ser-Thr-rich glycosyl-phosphatidyl-inositol-anchored membrane family domain-containing protein [Trichoderma breve]
MKYSVAAISAFAAVALAKPEFLNSAFQVQEGKPFTLEYSGCSSGCEIVLQTGASTNLKDVKVLASSATGSSTTVTLEDIPSGIYSFKITDKSGESNYSQQFSYQGSGKAVSSASSATSAAESNTAAPTSETTTAEPTSTKASSTKEHSTTLVKSTTAHSTTEEASSTTAHSSIPPKHNSTTVAPTHAATTTTGRQTTAASTSSNPAITTVPPGSAAGRLSSPLALVAGVALAIAFFS